jgi:hypothetical protein
MMMSAKRIGTMLTFALMVSCSLGQTTYFPAKTLEPPNLYPEILREWYSRSLVALKEPSLFELAQNQTTHSYRFLWLRTFNNPVAIRLNVNADGTGTLIEKVTSGEAGFRPGSLTVSFAKPLTQKQTNDFVKKIEILNFWSIPTIDPAIGGTDGSEWIIEGVHDGKYHVVNRWTPSSGPIRELGLAMAVNLAGMNIPGNELY